MIKTGLIISAVFLFGATAFGQQHTFGSNFRMPGAAPATRARRVTNDVPTYRVRNRTETRTRTTLPNLEFLNIANFLPRKYRYPVRKWQRIVLGNISPMIRNRRQ